MDKIASTYMIPVEVYISGVSNPDAVAKRLAECMYDVLNLVSGQICEDKGHIGIEWSIYKKTDPETFGAEEGEENVETGTDSEQ